ncbi:MAG TPA: histidine kinase, partial [Dermatophilaceae bacterium]|nr:histidine kinase [Dermatophilaceae bacterium]
MSQHPMDGVPEADSGTPSGLPGFVTLTSGSAADPAADIPSSGRILGQLLFIAAALVLLVTVGATVATSRLAEHEAINDAANTADLLARSVVTPALTDSLVDADPAAIASLDQAVRRSVLPNNIVRVKVWRPDGTVVYADDHRLIGRTFVLDVEQQETLSSPQTRAEVSDLSRAENEFERLQGRLLEVYRPVWTPDGHQLMFEVYGDYAPVEARAAELRRGLAGLLVSTVLLLVTLMAPLLWRLVTRLRSASRQREALLQRAVDASEEERRRIAVNLHDGPVQELVASAYAVAGAAERADSRGEAEVARAVRAAEGSVRGTVGSLRS